MFLVKMIGFCKSRKCPSSEMLLEYHSGNSTPEEAVVVFDHLEVCDFCAAELDLYAHSSQEEENVSLSDIPRPLFELADSLLNNRHKDSSLLDKLLIEDKGLTLTEA